MARAQDKADLPHIADTAWAVRLLRAIEEFRKVNIDATANQMATLIFIALHPGTSQREICEAMHLDAGTVSRILAVLSDRGSRGKEGLGLIEIEFDETDYRSRVQRLSKRGLQVWDSIRHLMLEK